MSAIDLDIDSRRQAAEARLEQLRTTRGVALLDGLGFDDELIRAAVNELDALTAAEGKSVRRERESIAKAEAERIEKLRAKLVVTEQHRLEAIERADKASHELADALKETMTRSAEVTAPAARVGRAPRR